MKFLGISIIIATWNGRGLLEKNLPSLFRVLGNYGGSSEVIVVDDAGTDDTETFLRECYPEVHYLRLPANVGNGQAMNEGARISQYEIIFFLDNDVTVTNDFLETLIPHFGDPDVFAAGSRAILAPEDLGPFQFPRVRFRFGIFWYYYESLPADWEDPVVVLFASAGHAAFRRSMFEELKGFDLLYGRFYLEDLDLCYRAWKKGWKSLTDPRSHVVHQAAGTIRRILSENQIKRRQWRNRFLFTWKNLHSPSLMVEHFLLTFPAVMVSPLLGKGVFTLGFLDALGHFGKAWQRRKEVLGEMVLSDHEVLDVLKPYQKGEGENVA